MVAGPIAAVLVSHPALDRPTKTFAEQTVSIHLDTPPIPGDVFGVRALYARAGVILRH